MWTSGKQIARFWEHEEKHIFLKSVAESPFNVPFDGVFATGCDHRVPCCRPHSHRMCAARLWSLALVAAALEVCCRRAWFTPWLASASEICSVVFGVLQLDKLLSMISSMVHGFCGTYFHSRLRVQCTCTSVLSPLAGLALPVSKRIAAGALTLELDQVHVCRYRECVCVGSVLGAYDTRVIRTLRAPR